MIVVVADASPLNYLIQIHSQRVLPILYDRVLIPDAVFQELHHRGAPELVRAWLRSIPEWMEVRLVRSPGVRLVRRKGLAVTGTLGVLIQAARRGLVDIEAALTDLQATDFRWTPELFKQAKERIRREEEKP